MTSSSFPKLSFKKRILSSAKDQIPLKELLERLDALSTELSKVDQEKFDTSSLESYKNDLINKKLIGHRDQGVQSLVACCLSDILRIYAPDAPYTDSELSDIFRLFVKQFRKLANPDNGYYTQQVYLITRLAEVRSIILVTDISENTALIESIFELFYDSSNFFHKKLEPVISDILIEIISEWDQISTTVLKLILNKFLTSSTSKNAITSNLSTSNSSQLNFTINICNANPDRLARHLTKFFSEVLYENSEEEEGAEVSYNSLVKLHNLTTEIWKNVPEILGSVMGLIDNELNADNEKFRILATETVGKILSAQSRLNFIQTHKETWINWMKKTLDISVLVRVKWVQQVPGILINRSDSIQEITNGLSKTLIDTDERVRVAAIKSIGSLPSSIILQKLNNASVLKATIQLVREKHLQIRQEAIRILGDLFDESYDQIYQKNLNDGTLKFFQEIPSQLLNLYYINDTSTNAFVDTVLLEKIFPPIDDDFKRVQRILNVVSNLDLKAKSSFIAFNKRQQQLSDVLRKLIEFSEEYNGGANEDVYPKILKTIAWLAKPLPDDISPRESIQKFININNRRLYYLLKLVISSDSDFSTLKNSLKEFFTRIQDPKIFNSVKDSVSVSNSEVNETFKLLTYRSSSNLFNRSNIAALLKLNDDETYRIVSQDLIDSISTISPTAFESQISDLITIIKDSEIGGEFSKVNTLKALYHILKKLKDKINEKDYNFFDKLIEFARFGSPSEAKYAVKVLSLSSNAEVLCTRLFDKIYPLKLEDNEKFSSNLAVIAQLFLSQPAIPEEVANDITPVLIKEVLLKNKVGGDEKDPSWTEELSEDTLTKINALKFFTNRLRSLAQTEPNSESTTSTFEHVLKLFSSLIGNGGEIVNSKSDSFPTPKYQQSRLRVEAGLQLLKLAKFPIYNRLIKPHIIDRLVLLVQDENEHVRYLFITKLTAYLKREEVSLKFLPLVFLVAFEPNDSLKNEIKTWIKSTFIGRSSTSHDRNDIVYEKSLTSLIYLISHHSEFLEYIEAKEDKEDNLLKAFIFSLEYIVFFLDTIANDQNISLLYYFANRVKQYRDASFDEEDYHNNVDSVNNLYRVSDLAQIAIKELQDHKNWTLQTYPSKIDLSSELFKSMKSSKEAQDVISTSFIPESILKKLKTIVKQKISTISHTNSKRVRSNEVIGTKIKKTKVDKSDDRRVYKKRQTIDSDDDENDGNFSVSYKSDANTRRKSSRRPEKHVDYILKGSDDEEINEDIDDTEL